MSASRRLEADLALVFNSFVWGSTFVVVKAALADASPLVFLLLRFAIASALLVALWGRRARLREPAVLRAALVVGFFLAAGYVFQTIGLQYTTPAKSAFITALSVPLVPVLLVALHRRAPGWAALAGVALATVGAYFLTVPAGALAVSQGDFITFFCSIFFAAHIVAIGHYVPRHGIASVAVGQIGAGFVLLAAAVPFAFVTGVEAPRLVWNARLVFALVATALFATALAFVLQTWAQQFTSPTHTAIIFSLEPVFAALTSYLVVGEVLGARGLVGAGLILAGVLVAEFRGGLAPGGQGSSAAANPGRPPTV